MNVCTFPLTKRNISFHQRTMIEQFNVEKIKRTIQSIEFDCQWKRYIYVCWTVSFYFNCAKLCDEANQTKLESYIWISNHLQLSAISSNATDILNTLIDFVMIECENVFSLERFAENVI